MLQYQFICSIVIEFGGFQKFAPIVAETKYFLKKDQLIFFLIYISIKDDLIKKLVL